MSDAHRARVGRYLSAADMKGRKVQTPILESIKAGRETSKRRRGRHWLSATINRLRFSGTQYSKRSL